jgi:hydroxymethylpyrimidine/phosphomethylpyrimidine kinase
MVIANILSIAGSDPSGGAGIQADLKTFSALGTYGMAVIAGLTAQNTHGVHAVEMPSTRFIDTQLKMILEDVRVDAIKIGMLGTADVVEAVANRLADGYKGPIVLDPVMVAKSGDALLQEDAVEALRERLLPLATVITPNLPEADALVGTQIRDATDMPLAASKLLALGCESVLLKGGHLSGEQSPDLLATATQERWLHGERINTRHTHGTGCTLSSAIAAHLGRGMSVSEAVTESKRYISSAIRHAEQLSVGNGIGPVHHFYATWSAPSRQSKD